MASAPELELPGFRFHPTEEELLEFYLKSVVFGKRSRSDIIDFLNIYLHDPWKLPGLAKIGEREWYFFVERERKNGSNGGRPNRTTATGFWKATGSDRKIVSLSDPKRVIGLKKTLVFYTGRAPRGNKTDWVMNEYRLPDYCKILKDIVLCKIYRKATSLKVLEQRAAMEEEIKMGNFPTISSSSIQQTHRHHQQHHDPTPPLMTSSSTALKRDLAYDDAALAVLLEQLEEAVLLEQLEEEEQEVMKMKEEESPTSVIETPFGKDELAEIVVPDKMSMEWAQLMTQDQFWAPLNSPWLLSTPNYANLELI